MPVMYVELLYLEYVYYAACSAYLANRTEIVEFKM